MNFFKGSQFWVMLICIVMALSASFVAVFIVLGTDDPGLAKVPNYYQKGKDWNDHQQQRIVNESLGWQATWDVSPQADGSIVTLRLLDAQGQPVGDDVVATGFHNADPTRVTDIAFEQKSLGVFAAQLHQPRIGWWRLHARVQVPASEGNTPVVFTAEERLFLAPVPDEIAFGDAE